MNIVRVTAMLLLVFGLAACDSKQEPPSTPKTAPAATEPPIASQPTARPSVDPQILARGEQLFRQNCGACHGDHAQGAPNWQKPGPDGKYPAPPLDGSAHAWHHPRLGLIQVIKQGTLKIGGNMPAWQGKLSDAVIIYFQSLWPDEIYAAWRQMDVRGRR